MIDMNKLMKRTAKTQHSRVTRELNRLDKKRNSPGVPPNTCPYINMVQEMIDQLQHSYDDLKDKNHHNPMTEDIAVEAKQMLEVVRRMNETLRDNSGYWYQEYKRLQKKQ